MPLKINKPKRKQVLITMDQELLKRIDQERKRKGVTRTRFIEYCALQYLSEAQSISVKKDK